jgi:transcriptional regulator GlxA family with amidase domain
MKKRHLLWIAVAILIAGAAGFAGWLFTRPPATAVAAAPAIPQEEAEATLAALKPPKRERPLIAVIGINDATETTDYLMPYGILRRADVADVVAVATDRGPVTLFPALKVAPDMTVAEFNERHPDGADYVIVPAMSRDDDAAALHWIRTQAAKGALVVGVCAGAKVVAAAGLLDGKRATTHWYYLDELRGEHPSINYVADRRLVVDQGVATTTGITASMPAMLTLIEAIAGREKAEAVASDLGLAAWDARHDSDAFRFTRSFALTAIGNTAAIWNWEKLGIELAPGADEVVLALVADAWSRTFRSRALTYAPSGAAMQSRNGLRIIPDRVETNWPAGERVSSGDQPPAKALDLALHQIAQRYGARTVNFVAAQLEYDLKRSSRKDAAVSR